MGRELFAQSSQHLRCVRPSEQAIVRLVHRLTDNIEDLQAQLIRSPQPVIASLSKQLAKVKSTLSRKTAELIRERQLNHQLLRRLRELERVVERGDLKPVQRDSHNSSLPPSLDPPWQKVPRTKSLRKNSGRKPGGQFGHRGTTLKQVTQPDEIIIHAPLACTNCATSLPHDEATTRIRRQVFDISDGRVKVTEHQAETRRCPACALTRRAMDEIGILPQFRGTLVRDGFSSYQCYEQCRHSLCNAHLLRDLLFVEESSPQQKVWTEPLSKLLLKIKDTVAQVEVKTDTQLSEQAKNDFLRRYDRLVKRADRLNPPQPRRKDVGDAAKKSSTQLTPRRLVNCLQRRRYGSPALHVGYECALR
jgi:exonuclease VII large subunit